MEFTWEKARREYYRKYREKNREKLRQYSKEWHEKNPGKSQEYQDNYWKKRAAEFVAANNTEE